MSDEVAAAPSAPSTADVASEVIESFEPSESSGAAESPSGTEEVSSPQVAEPKAIAEPSAQAPAVVKQLTDEEKLLEEYGFKEAYKPDGREHYIARSKVLKMIGSGLKRGTEKWTAEKAEIEQRANAYKADLDELYTDVRGEPAEFLKKIASYDPRYRAFLEQQAAPAPAPVQVPNLPMPQPDLTLQDGSRTYSIDGLQKLLEWNTAQVEAKLLPKVDERLKPYAEREKESKAREEAEKATAAVRERTHKTIAEAQNWPGFKEHEAAILKALQEDSAKAKSEGRRPTLSLEAAYRQAVLPKMTADRNTMREELLKEMSSAAKATPTATRGGGEVPKVGALTTADIARRTIEQLEG
jgi:hypothetical protein